MLAREIVGLVDISVILVIVISFRYSETRFFPKISRLPRAFPEGISRFEGKSEVLNEERIKLSVSPLYVSNR